MAGQKFKLAKKFATEAVSNFRNPHFRNPLLRNPLLRNPLLRNPLLRNPLLRNPLLRNPLLRNQRGLYQYGTFIGPLNNGNGSPKQEPKQEQEQSQEQKPPGQEPDKVKDVPNKLSGSGISSNVRGRIDALKNDRFKFELSKEEVDNILSNGRQLGFSDKDISDAMFTASRVDKRVGSQELIRRLDNHVNIVQKRGYPFGFDSLEQFNSYKQGVIEELKRYDIPVSDVRIHGSSVLKETPDDLDIAIIVDDKTFDSLTQRFVAASSISSMAKQVNKEAIKGKIPSRLFAPVMNPTVLKGIYEKGLSPLKSQVTLIRQGSQFDLGPYLNF